MLLRAPRLTGDRYEYMIDNVIMLLKGTLNGRDVNDLIHQVGWFCWVRAWCSTHTTSIHDSSTRLASSTSRSCAAFARSRQTPRATRTCTRPCSLTRQLVRRGLVDPARCRVKELTLAQTAANNFRPVFQPVLGGERRRRPYGWHVRRPQRAGGSADGADQEQHAQAVARGLLQLLPGTLFPPRGLHVRVCDSQKKCCRKLAGTPRW